MADNSQSSRPPTPPSSVPSPHSIFGPRTLASMPPIRIPPPTYQQVGPPPPVYPAAPLAPPMLPVHFPGLSIMPPGHPGPGSPRIAGPSQPRLLPMRDAIPPRSRSPTPPAPEFQPEPYKLNVTHVWTPGPAELAATSSQPTRGRPASVKTDSVTKPLSLVLTDINRVDFVTALLRVHNLHTNYRVTADGPPFNIWWPGSTGGKKDAPLIENDEDFDNILQRILVKRVDTNIGTLIHADKMQLWRIRKRGLPEDGFDELGARPAPNSLPSSETSLHPNIIMALKGEHSCELHTADHGAPGFCLKLSKDVHIFLTHLHFKIWAAALAAGNATLKNPPEHEMFRDPNREQNEMNIIPAIRTNRTSNRRASTTATPASDSTAIASSVAMSFAASLAGALAAFHNPNTGALTAANTQLGIQAPAMPLGHAPSTGIPRALSPVPEAGTELDVCLAAFKSKYGVDLLGRVPILQLQGLGPDIIHECPYKDLATLLDISEGDALRLQIFSREWWNKHMAKVSK